jgi:hypothetical protein
LHGIPKEIPYRIVEEKTKNLFLKMFPNEGSEDRVLAVHSA